MSETRLYDGAALEDFASRNLQAVGVSRADADLVAESLVLAELWGHVSHGVLRLPWYYRRLKSGAMRPDGVTKTLQDTGPLVLLDGDGGVGQVLTQRATEAAIDRAREHGVGLVGVRNSNHFGTAAYFSRQAAEAGFATLLFTNASPAMAPWGGKDKRVGTNPWSIAAPAGKHGVAVMDMANTGVARGKVYAAAAKGEEIPTTWAAGPDGLPTDDPALALQGLMLPMAGPKGYAISFMIDVLAGALTGSGVATDVVGPYEPQGSSNCGHLVICIDVETMVGLEAFEKQVEELIDATIDSAVAPGVEQIYTPGKIEDQNLKRLSAEGIPVTSQTLDELRVLSEETQTPMPRPLGKDLVS